MIVYAFVALVLSLDFFFFFIAPLDQPWLEEQYQCLTPVMNTRLYPEAKPSFVSVSLLCFAIGVFCYWYVFSFRPC